LTLYRHKPVGKRRCSPQTMSDEHPHEGKDCTYCEDGTLHQIKDWDNPLECSNGGECPATFVAVVGIESTDSEQPGGATQ